MIYFQNAVRRNRTELAMLGDIITSHCNRSEFILKNSVSSLETQICGLLSSTNVVSVSSHFSALVIVLKAIGISVNDYVAVPAYGYSTTVHAVIAVGAKPLFVDIDPDTFLISPGSVTFTAKKSRTVIATSVFGQPIDRDNLRLAFTPNTQIVLDGNISLAVHAQYKNAHDEEDTSVYSLNPDSTLGGIGEAGLIVTENPRLARVFRMLRNHGQNGKQRFVHHLLGFNSRMDDINAAVVAGRVKDVEADNLSRREIAEKYTQFIKDHAGVLAIDSNLPTLPSEYVIAVPNPTEFLARMHDKGVEVGSPSASYLPSHPSFQTYDTGNCPNANWVAGKLVALPFYPGMSEHETDHVIKALGECL
jgi:dTDP-4-amino-4,6-dideoxygalactose transaminase